MSQALCLVEFLDAFVLSARKFRALIGHHDLYLMLNVVIRPKVETLT